MSHHTHTHTTHKHFYGFFHQVEQHVTTENRCCNPNPGIYPHENDYIDEVYPIIKADVPRENYKWTCTWSRSLRLLYRYMRVNELLSSLGTRTSCIRGCAGLPEMALSIPLYDNIYSEYETIGDIIYSCLG